jgi:hypothetical protein
MLFSLCVLIAMILGVNIGMQNNCQKIYDSYVFLS